VGSEIKRGAIDARERMRKVKKGEGKGEDKRGQLTVCVVGTTGGLMSRWWNILL